MGIVPFSKSLLLIVDVQNGFINSATQKVIPTISSLVEKYKSQAWPIVCSRFVNPEGGNWERLRDWHEMKGEPQTELSPELKVDTPYVLKKSTYSAWSDEVSSICTSHGVRDVVIVGVDTNECVLATAIAIFDAGLTPWVAEDACASGGGTEPHEMALTLLKTMLGEQQIITTKEVL